MLRASAHWALAAFVPSTAIAVYYVLQGARTGDDLAALISALSFVATLVGPLAALTIVRRKLRGMRWIAVVIATVGTTVVLLVAVRTVPRWPFADVGLIISWALLSAAVTVASIGLAGVGMPNNSLERTRER